MAVLLLGLMARSTQAASSAQLCRPVTFAHAAYTVCTVDLAQYRLKLFLKGPDGEPFGAFARVAQAEPGLVFAMNAGMYHEDRSPVGLYIENGRQLKAASTAAGPGNFHMKPNGVFYVSDQGAGVAETGRFLTTKPRPDFATQSGPMLVIDGRIHPRFSETSGSYKIRNGVGVRDAHTAIFAISDEPVTFSAFAHLFRDALKCRNALFLDGSISALYAPALGRADITRSMGPIVGAVKR